MDLCIMVKLDDPCLIGISNMCGGEEQEVKVEPLEDGMIFDMLEGSLWLFSSHIEFYTSRFESVEEACTYFRD